MVTDVSDVVLAKQVGTGGYVAGAHPHPKPDSKTQFSYNRSVIASNLYLQFEICKMKMKIRSARK